MFKTKVCDNTTTGEPIQNLKVNASWFQRNKKKIKVAATSTVIIALLLGLSKCSCQEQNLCPNGNTVVDPTTDSDHETIDDNEDYEKKEDEKNNGGDTTNKNNSNQKPSDNSGSDTGNKNDGSSDQDTDLDQKPSPKPEKPNPKPDPKPEKPNPKPDPEPEKPDQKPDPEPEKPDPKPDPEPEKPDPKPDPEPEKPAEDDRNIIKDDEDRQPDIGSNEGDFVLPSQSSKMDAQTIYRVDVSEEALEISNSSIQISYLKEIRAEFEQLLEEPVVEDEVVFTR